MNNIIRNILNILGILIVEYLLGTTLGMVLGAFIGALPGLFYREIVNSGFSIIMSISISLILGILNGLIATLMFNKFYCSNGKLFNGTLLGFAIGLTGIFFDYGIINVESFEINNYQYYLYPIIYSGIVGSNIGEIIFPIIGAILFVRSIIEDNKSSANNAERLEEIKKSLGINSSNVEKRG